MGVQAVGSTIQAFLDPDAGSGVPFLGTVYPALPKVGNEADLFNYSPPGQTSGAAIYTFFRGQRDKRIALGGRHSGEKMISHEVILLCIFKSDRAKASDAAADYSVFIDGLISRIRSDRNAGDPTVIFQWGEGEVGGAGDDIIVEHSVPKTMEGGTMLFHCTVTVTTIEVVNNE